MEGCRWQTRHCDICNFSLSRWPSWWCRSPVRPSTPTLPQASYLPSLTVNTSSCTTRRSRTWGKESTNSCRATQTYFLRMYRLTRADWEVDLAKKISQWRKVGWNALALAESWICLKVTTDVVREVLWSPARSSSRIWRCANTVQRRKSMMLIRPSAKSKRWTSI